MSSIVSTEEPDYYSENPDFTPPSEVLDPLADPIPEPPLSLDAVSAVAKRTLRVFSADKFRAVYTTAIEQGLTSKQTLKEMFGQGVVAILNKPNRTPDPATCRQILSFISELDTVQAKGSVKPHRHAKPRQELMLAME